MYLSLFSLPFLPPFSPPLLHFLPHTFLLTSLPPFLSPSTDVLVWTNAHVQLWVQDVGLADHAPCLRKTEAHGGASPSTVISTMRSLAHPQIRPSNFEVRGRDRRRIYVCVVGSTLYVGFSILHDKEEQEERPAMYIHVCMCMPTCTCRWWS